jgi:hypothetical protein
MARLAAKAEIHVLDLIDHYNRLERDAAITRLLDAVAAALAAYDDRPRLSAYPANYRDLAPLGLHWMKQHRYWFGALLTGEGWVIATVLFESADIPGRVNTDPS